MRRLVTALTVIAPVLVASGSLLAPVAAVDLPGGQTPTPTGTSAGGTPAVAVLRGPDGGTVATYRRGGRGGGGSGPAWECTYHEPTAGSGAIPGADRDHVATVEVGRSYWLICRENGNEVYAQVITWDPRNPFGSIAAGERAAEEARNQIAIANPEIHTAPGLDRPQLVGLATWLWVTDPWVPRTASASLGGVTATVTATPSQITWSPGDGSPTLRCDGPGTVFDEHHPDRPSSCAHTYQRRSTVDGPDGAFALTATITYTVEWRATNGQAGPLDPITRTATVPVTVHEAQAVIE